MYTVCMYMFWSVLLRYIVVLAADKFNAFHCMSM